MSVDDDGQQAELVKRGLAVLKNYGGVAALVESHGPGGVARVTRGGEDFFTRPFEELRQNLAAAESEGRAVTYADLFPPPRRRMVDPNFEVDPALVDRLLGVLSGGGDPLDAMDAMAEFLSGGGDGESTPRRKKSKGCAKKSKGRVKGYATWNPHKPTRVILAQVQQVLNTYREHLPLTIRQVFYVLVGNYGYPKDEAAYNRLKDMLTRARRAKLIEFEDLRDDGISVLEPTHFNDANAFYTHIREQGEAYRRNKLARQGLNMRVLCEAAGMMPQLSRVAQDYSVPVYSCGGFDSLTAKYELARSIHDSFVYEGRPTVLLHLGDYDPSGLSIYESTVEDVLAFISEDVQSHEPEHVARFERMALSADQIEEYDLTTYPPKGTDGRAKSWLKQGRRTCQLEALPPDELARELRDAIEAHLNLDRLEDDRKQEKQERQEITRALPSGDPNAN